MNSQMKRSILAIAILLLSAVAASGQTMVKITPPGWGSSSTEAGGQIAQSIARNLAVRIGSTARYQIVTDNSQALWIVINCTADHACAFLLLYYSLAGTQVFTVMPGHPVVCGPTTSADYCAQTYFEHFFEATQDEKLKTAWTDCVGALIEATWRYPDLFQKKRQ